MKINLRRIKGINYSGFDWSPNASTDKLKSYYQKNQKHFKPNYEFEVQGVTYRVERISEKRDPIINFSCNY